MISPVISAMCRQKVMAFATACNPQFESAVHLNMIARKLQRIESGELKRLMVFMPPRHGKSFLISQYFPAWYMGRNPNKKVILTSYSQDVASDFGRKVRNQITSSEFQDIFPDVRVTDDSNATKRFHLVNGGEFFAVGSGGALTSRGGDLIIIDDVHKNREELESPEQRNKVEEWYKSTLYTRLMPGGAIILVQTRWHLDDLPGRLLKQNSDQWEVLELPAISDAGVALWPHRFPIETLQKIKQTIGTYEFEAQYQQRPTLREGGIIKRDWLKYWEILPDAHWDMLIQSWDLAFKGEGTSDYVVGSVWGKLKGRAYLLDQVRARMNFPETLSAFRQFSAKHKGAGLKLVEEKANGAALIAMLQKEIPGIVPVNPDKAKELRLHAVAPFFEAGNVYLPKNAPWIHDYVEELVNFGSWANDDQCFVAGTMIATPIGDIPIEKIKAGDLVISPLGPTIVDAAGQTGVSKVIERHGLIGTPNHKIFDGIGFTNLDSISHAVINKLSWKSLIRWTALKLYFSTEQSLDLWAGRDVITYLNTTPIKAGNLPSACMWLFLSFILKRRYRKATTFITLMVIHLIIVTKTWSAYRSRIIARKLIIELRRSWQTLIRLDHLPKHGTNLRPDINGIKNMVKTCLVICLKSKQTVINAARFFGLGKTPTQDFVHTNVMPSGVGIIKDCNINSLVLCANEHARSQSHDHLNQNQKHVPGVVGVNSPTAVYNLKTKSGVYYANGILVSNCDSTTQALARLFIAAVGEWSDNSAYGTGSHTIHETPW